MTTTKILPTGSARRLVNTIKRMLKPASQIDVLDFLDSGAFDINDPSTWMVTGIDVESALENAARMRGGGHWVQDPTYNGGYRWVEDEHTETDT